MTRPRWLAHATALPRRALSSSRPRDPSRWQIPPGPRGGTGAASTVKSRSLIPDFNEEKEAFAEWKKSLQPALSSLEEASRKTVLKPPVRIKRDTRSMLIITGLSPSLKAADFHRLSAKDVSDWSKAIADISQDRDPWTLEPLGTYRITFPSSFVAVAFRDKLERLLQLSQLKLHSANGLWMSQVPVHLRNSDSDLEEEVNSFTIAPGSQPKLKIYTGRPKGQPPWVRLIEKLVTESPYPTSNGVVLLHLQNPCMVAEELMRFINQDGHDRNQAWNVHKPYHLTRTLHEEDLGLKEIHGRVPLPDNHEFRAKLRSRFVIVCENEDVASRFIRSWNQRTLTANSRGYTQRTLVNASLIEW